MEDIKEALEVAKLLIIAMAEDQELLNANAKLAINAFDAYRKVGFSESEAMTLTVAAMNNNNKQN